MQCGTMDGAPEPSRDAAESRRRASRRTIVLVAGSIAAVVVAASVAMALAQRPLSAEETELVGNWYTLADDQPDTRNAVLVCIRADRSVTFTVRMFARVNAPAAEGAAAVQWHAAPEHDGYTTRWQRDGASLVLFDPDPEPWWRKVRGFLDTWRWPDDDIRVGVRLLNPDLLELTVPTTSDPQRLLRVPGDFKLPEQPQTIDEVAAENAAR